jgi:hypothetical protein
MLKAMGLAVLFGMLSVYYAIHAAQKVREAVSFRPSSPSQIEKK